MFNIFSRKRFLPLFLLFCVASSKLIIIYNEETLVALSFLAFVLFCFHYFGNTVQDSLNERADTIAVELGNFHKSKEQAILNVLLEHKKIPELKKIIRNMDNTTQKMTAHLKKSANTSVLSGGVQNVPFKQLQDKFKKQIIAKFSEIKLSKIDSNLGNAIQTRICKTIEYFILGRLLPKKTTLFSSFQSAKGKSANRKSNQSLEPKKSDLPLSAKGKSSNRNSNQTLPQNKTPKKQRLNRNTRLQCS